MLQEEESIMENISFKKNSKDEEYVQAFVPDKSKIAEMLNIAKGNRTMAQLAEACGVSASTLSRALNGKNTKPLVIDLIMAIYENSADQSEAFFEKLMLANGMISKEANKKRKSLTDFNKKLLIAQRATEQKIQKIIGAELFRRDYAMKFFKSLKHRKKWDSKYFLYWASSFAFEIERDNEKLIWNFCIISLNSDQDAIKLQLIMEKVSGLFLTDAWEPEKFDGIKNSFIFTSPEIYNIYLKSFFGAKMNGDFSIILADIENEKIAEEIMMPRIDGKERSSVFAESVIESDEDNTFYVMDNDFTDFLED